MSFWLFFLLCECFIPQSVLFPAGMDTHSIALGAALGRWRKPSEAAISVGSRNWLLCCCLFGNTAPGTEWVTKEPPFSVSSALQKPGLAREVCVTHGILPFVPAIIREVQKRPGSWGCGHRSVDAALRVLKCRNHSIWRALHLSKLPTACLWLLKNNENPPHFRRGARLWLYLATRIPVQLRLLKTLGGGEGPYRWRNVHFVSGAAERSQPLLAVTLSLAWPHSPGHWTWQKSCRIAAVYFCPLSFYEGAKC